MLENLAEIFERKNLTELNEIYELAAVCCRDPDVGVSLSLRLTVDVSYSALHADRSVATLQT